MRVKRHFSLGALLGTGFAAIIAMGCWWRFLVGLN
jgi:hypothetical protein